MNLPGGTTKTRKKVRVSADISNGYFSKSETSDVEDKSIQIYYRKT
jgi:hypothetical protein